jgi:hypothetical protein
VVVTVGVAGVPVARNSVVLPSLHTTPRPGDEHAPPRCPIC